MTVYGNPDPTLVNRPASTGNRAEALRLFSASYGLTLDKWQYNAAEIFLGVTAEGMWAADMCGLVVPRQQGKTELTIALMLAGAILFDEKLVVYSAHSAKTVREVFRRVKGYLEQVPALSKRVSKIFSADGREYIELKTGNRMEFFTRSKGNIRGFTADRIILDEAQEFPEEALEAIIYAVSAIPNHQIVITGTVPGPTAQGEVLTRHHDLAVAGSSPRLAWAEWSATPDADPEDEATVARCNPAYGHRLTKDTVDRERFSSSAEGFGRERLGVWDSSRMGAAVIDPETWRNREVDINLPAAEITEGMALALDVNHARDRASVAVAGMNDEGDYVVSLLEQFSNPDQAVKFIAAATEKNDVRAVIVDARSQAGTLVDALKRNGVRATVTSERDMAAACGTFFDGMYDGWLFHIGQPQLTIAQEQARKRPLLGGDAWGWNRRSSSSDITPIVAASLALHGAMNTDIKRPRKRKRDPVRMIHLPV